MLKDAYFWPLTTIHRHGMRHIIGWINVSKLTYKRQMRFTKKTLKRDLQKKLQRKVSKLTYIRQKRPTKKTYSIQKRSTIDHAPPCTDFTREEAHNLSDKCVHKDNVRKNTSKEDLTDWLKNVKWDLNKSPIQIKKYIQKRLTFDHELPYTDVRWGKSSL